MAHRAGGLHGDAILLLGSGLLLYQGRMRRYLGQYQTKYRRSAGRAG